MPYYHKIRSFSQVYFTFLKRENSYISEKTIIFGAFLEKTLTSVSPEVPRILPFGNIYLTFR